MFTKNVRTLHTGEYCVLVPLCLLIIGVMLISAYWIHVGSAIAVTYMVCSLITASIVGSHEPRSQNKVTDEEWIDSEYLSDFIPT